MVDQVELLERVARAIDPYAFRDPVDDTYAEARICRAFEKARAAIEAISTFPHPNNTGEV